MVTSLYPPEISPARRDFHPQSTTSLPPLPPMQHKNAPQNAAPEAPGTPPPEYHEGGGISKNPLILSSA